MPSSDPVTIPKILQLVAILNPRSILDVGAGNGRYGFLFRETLDWNYGRFENPQVRIDAVEIEPSYISPVHHHVYDNIYIGDWLSLKLEIKYDLIFMGDVLEHFEEWRVALFKAKVNAKCVIVVAPNWQGSIAQGPWFGNEHETHRVALTPAMMADGRFLFATSKIFIVAFGSEDILSHRDILL